MGGTVTGEVANIAPAGRCALAVAEALCRELNPAVTPVVAGRFRAGDIRHCFADIKKARSLLGYAPAMSFEDGLHDLLGWVRGQTADDAFDREQGCASAASLSSP
jgi:dTDP-L-rhamnose 4-epimerase